MSLLGRHTNKANNNNNIVEKNPFCNQLNQGCVSCNICFTSIIISEFLLIFSTLDWICWTKVFLMKVYVLHYVPWYSLVITLWLRIFLVSTSKSLELLSKMLAVKIQNCMIPKSQLREVESLYKLIICNFFHCMDLWMTGL